ncbi:MAG: hypothetical protein GY721_06720 [Deltaproteobacteria bacterium]|nr:hypothetical protein [Deltaproteobacteria bacterium]
MKKYIALLLLLIVIVPFSVAHAVDEGTECTEGPGELLLAIKLRSNGLDRREERVHLEELQIKTLRSEIDDRISQLSKVRKEMEQVVEELRMEKDKGVKKLAKIYENMEAEEAATRIELIDNDLAVRLLKSMKQKSAAGILAVVKPKKAAQLTQKLDKSLSPR